MNRFLPHLRGEMMPAWSAWLILILLVMNILRSILLGEPF
jgi:hypothetical protein